MVIYTGETQSGAPAVPISATTSGYCWSNSEAAARSDAWRCTAGNNIHDPCFGSYGIDYVVCPDVGPWTGRAIEMRLTKPLPPGANQQVQAGLQGDPWALELANGSTCEFLTGAGSLVAGLRENYSCSGHLILYGDPSRSSRIWTIFGGAANSPQLIEQKIRIAWF